MRNTTETYKIFLKEQELAEGTVKIYMRYALKLEEYIQNAGLSKKTILEFKKNLEDEKTAPSTFNLAIISVNKYLKYCGYEKYTVKTQKIQKRKSLENVISISEYKKMLESVKTGRLVKYYYIMKALAQTGIRVSELQYFTVEILEKKKITINNKGKVREIYCC